MITFNVGPSKIHPEVAQYLQNAYDNNILSISHRSKEFDSFSKRTLELLHEKLNIPADYEILYTGSATESWEIIAQDVVNKQSIHFYNGEFGKKWFEYAQFINRDSRGYKFDENELISPSAYLIPAEAELLCFTLNETSTGTQVRENIIIKFKELNPNALVAIDTTSCLGGINIDFGNYDFIFGSVQKCFGLPAGLGLLICSPKAVSKAAAKNVTGRYNSLLSMLDKIKAYQTNYTPNVLGIYLLFRVMEKMEHVTKTDQIIKERAQSWYNFITTIPELSLHVNNKEVQSDTIITVKTTEERVALIKKEAKNAGIELGSGYGALKNSTFRIANFPAITEEEIQILKRFLSK